MQNNEYSTPVTKMNAEDAKTFFLKQKSYCNVPLPSYFDFETLLNKMSEKFGKKLLDMEKSGEASSEDVNYLFYANKDGNLSYRPLQLIHPLVYLHLVYVITEERHWEKIIVRFNKFKKHKEIECFSIPLQSDTKQSDISKQILSWWENIEQQSIALSLDFNYVANSDIADCYGSIYTHSIAWAIEGKKVAKKNRDSKLLGNKIDKIIQNAQYGQTNGIPQGSVLMDFIAEILLGYIDRVLFCKIKKFKIKSFKILRYRDDYRIFTKSYDDASRILKALSETLDSFGLKLNSSKTNISSDIIVNSIKADKVSFLTIKESIEKAKLFDRLLLLKEFALKYPNSGSLMRALSDINKNIKEIVENNHKLEQSISILVDIIFKNPRVAHLCISIISSLIDKMQNNKMQNVSDVLKSIIFKLSSGTHIDLLEIWLQRLIIKNKELNFKFKCKLTNAVVDNKVQIWNHSWVKSKDYKNFINKNTIINEAKLKEAISIIDHKEVDVFAY